MSETVAWRVPAAVTLDDVTAMNAADRHGHRFEVSPAGTLWVMPPTDAEHAAIASRLAAWLLLGGWPAEQVLQAVGVETPGPEGTGGRIPDLTVWARAQPPGAWLAAAELRLVVEIASPASATVDREVKPAEYAAAGIPRCWTVHCDDARTVTMHRLTRDRTYEVAAMVPLAWLLRTAPADQDLRS